MLYSKDFVPHSKTELERKSTLQERPPSRLLHTPWRAKWRYGEALSDDARVGRIYFAKSKNLVNLIRHLLTCEVSFLTKEDNALVIHQFRSTHTKTSNLDLIKYFQNRATRFSIQTYNLIIPLIPGRRKEIRQIKIQSFFQCQINLLYKWGTLKYSIHNHWFIHPILFSYFLNILYRLLR